MGQRAWGILWAIAACLLTAACGQSPRAATPSAKRPTVASAVPAATDILVVMGAANHLVGVSNFEPDTPLLRSLPPVGDYQVIDWERLTEIRPDVLIVPRPKVEFEEAFKQRAARLKVQLVPFHVDRLDDIYPTITALGAACGEETKAQTLAENIRQRLSSVRQSVRDRQSCTTLIVLDENAQFVVGPNNFLDDLLVVAGGTNVGGHLGKDFPIIDREQLLALDPQVIIQLLPEAQPQVLSAAGRFWKQLPQLQAVRNNRVYIHDQWFMLLPSAHVAEIAELFADDLHGLKFP